MNIKVCSIFGKDKMKIINWLNSKFRTIYGIRQTSEDNKTVLEYFFKKKKNRYFVYQNLKLENFSDHYENWCETHDYPISKKSWKNYQEIVCPSDNYVFFQYKVSVNDIRYKFLTYENISKMKTEEIINEIEKEVARIKNEEVVDKL